MQALHHNDEALDPHAYVYKHRHGKHCAHAGPDTFRPEHLNHKDIAEDQAPEHEAISTEHAVVHHVAVVYAPRVPGHEGFHHVPVAHDQTCGEHDLRHVVDVPHGNEVLKPEELAQRNR